MRDLIYDQETGACIAPIENQQVFRDRDGVKIGTVCAGTIYDLEGNVVGHLRGIHVTGLQTPTLPVSFKKLIDSGSAQ